MGKKSRLKREKREGVAGAVEVASKKGPLNPRDAKFEALADSLKAHFAVYRAADVITSLGVSELWRPNRSSMVKHALAMLVCLSMARTDFTESRTITSYENFSDFIGKLRELLPSFRMLEDFVPEGDWGEVRVPNGSGFEPIFYGCSVERIPDFIEAFRILAGDVPQALADMNLAVALQRDLVCAVEPAFAGHDDLVAPGHMEVPDSTFWAACSEALRSAYETVQSCMSEASSWVIGEQGSLRLPESMDAFGNLIMTGTALPLLFIRTADAVLPVSPRGATTVIIDMWSARVGAYDGAGLLAFGRRLGRYLAQRFRHDENILGPVQVIGKSGRFDPYLAAVLRSGNRFQFILPIGVGEICRLAQIERRLRHLINESERWGLALKHARQLVEFRNADGELPRGSAIELVAVIARVSTQNGILDLPETDARVIGLPDFVSLFDSLRNGAELEKFWTYLDDTSPIARGFVGLMDHFAAFRDTHALLVPGAVMPDLIHIDPHWNSGWRYKELKEFWGNAPRCFPDDLCTWEVEPMESGMTRLKARGPRVLAWSCLVGECTVQATMEIDESDPDFENGPMLELFVHCAVDALTQRGLMLRGLAPFEFRQVVLRCEMTPRLLPVRGDEAETASRATQPLLDAWELISSEGGAKLEVAVEVNISRLRSRLDCAEDASFEVECAASVVAGLCSLLRSPCDEDVLKSLHGTAGAKPRFTLRSMERTVDVPDHASADVPEPEHFKLARKELAVIFKDQGVVAPARYELEPAKQIMNAARDAMRSSLHERIATYDRTELLRVCVEQHDVLTSRYQQEVTRLQLSLTHEVSFDRAHLLAELQENFTSMSRNYRYLLECCLSLQGLGTARPAIEQVIQLIASVDWFLVLYGASDTLHNEIDVGGIELDDWYVPTVFFSGDRDEKQRRYLHEVANVKLGLGLKDEDEVTSERDGAKSWERLDTAFVTDLGCSLTRLMQVLEVLSRWHTAGGDTELRFRYSAPPATIVNTVREHFPDAPADQIAAAVAFLTLDPAGVRQLSGKTESEPDVPVWEHFKRVHRYVIRPIVPLQDGQLTWGAATAGRARAAWLGALSNGYLPAEFSWPNVARAVREIKLGIEKLLEVRAHEVCARHTAHALHGIDFRRRFAQERFDDVGDFDVLAYWPDRNLWLAVECKYNQPPFCLKDARRLRDRVFGNESNRAQFAKIERRLTFMNVHADRLRALLKWPTAEGAGAPTIRAIYVSRDIYWSLMYPPYPVPAEFVRIDALDGWLRMLLDPAALVESSSSQ